MKLSKRKYGFNSFGNYVFEGTITEVVGYIGNVQGMLDITVRVDVPFDDWTSERLDVGATNTFHYNISQNQTVFSNFFLKILNSYNEFYLASDEIDLSVLQNQSFLFIVDQQVSARNGNVYNNIVAFLPLEDESES